MITSDIFTLALVFLLLYSNVHLPQKDKSTIRLIRVLMLLTVTVASDLVTRLFIGTQGLFPRFLILSGLGLKYICATSTFAFYLRYLRTDFSNSDRLLPVNRYLTALRVTLGIFFIIMLLSSYFTHTLFWLDSYNHIFYGRFHSLTDIVMVLQVLILTLQVYPLYQVRKLDIGLRKRLIIYLGIILLAALADIPFPQFGFLYPAMVTSIYLIYINIHMALEKRTWENNLRLEKSRVEHLTWQIHPHFLFNSLLVIKELCAEDPQRAEQAVQDFADYLRDNLDAMNSNEMIPFEHELENVKHYVALEQADGSRNFDIVYDLKEKDFVLPALTVEPLVENAIRHGLKGISGGLVQIESWREEQEICIAVSDDGSGFREQTVQQGSRKSIGLQNVRDRLEAQCGGFLTIQSSSEGTRIIIHIPA